MDRLVVHPLIGVAPRQRDAGRRRRWGCSLSAARVRKRAREPTGCSAMGADHYSVNAMKRSRSLRLLLDSAFAGWPFRPRCPATSSSSRAITAAHPDYRTEWWYYTGHLRTESGKRYGFEVTFFRVGVVPPDGAEGDELGPAADHARALRHHRRRRQELPLLREAEPRLALHRRRGGGTPRRLQRRLARDHDPDGSWQHRRPRKARTPSI